jgi:hypothetical protein
VSDRIRSRLLKGVSRADAIPQDCIMVDREGDWWVRDGNVMRFLAAGEVEDSIVGVIDQWGPLHFAGFMLGEDYGAALDALVAVAEGEKFGPEERASIFAAVAVLFPGVGDERA